MGKPAGLLVSVSMIVALGLVSPEALGWGTDGHRMISELAVKSLLVDLPDFVRTPEAIHEVGYLGPEADRERGAGDSFDAERSPAHFIDVSDDLTILGGPLLQSLPPTREQYDTALRAAGSDQYKAGYLPYSIIQGFQLLTKDFAYWRVDVAGEKFAKTDAERSWYAQDRSLRESIVLHDLGTWSHFVADGSMPMHASVHYNGWGNFPNPEGFTQEHIHVPWENTYVHNNLTATDVEAAMPAYWSCSCTIEVRVAAYLTATQAQVVPFYRLEKAGAFALPSPERSSGSVQAGKSSSEGKAFTAKQVALGAAELRDMIIEAWRASADQSVGYPPVKVADVESGKTDPYFELSY
ncbi:MAG: hypothetical protein WCA81_17100 [Rhizomicrobium sp.]